MWGCNQARKLDASELEAKRAVRLRSLQDLERGNGVVSFVVRKPGWRREWVPTMKEKPRLTTRARSHAARARRAGFAPSAEIVAILAVVTAAALFLSSCWSEDAPEPPLAVRFTDATAAAGLTRHTPTYDSAVGDFDGDGASDLFVGNHEGSPALLRNRGNGTFADEIARSGIDPTGDHHGTSWTDVDNDGRLDLYVGLGAFRGRGEKANPLYRNRGDARFERAPLEAGVADPRGRSRATASFDYDGDGRLDLFVSNHGTPSRLFRNRGDGTFEDVSDATGIAPWSAELATWTDFDADRDPDLVLLEGPKGLRLLRNDASGAGRTFVDATEEVGLDPWIGAGGIAFGDYDNDGVLDLYVSRGWSYTANVYEAGDGVLTFALLGESFPRGFDFEAEGETGTAVEAELYERGAPAPPEQLRCGANGSPASHRFTCGGDEAVATSPPEIEPGYALWRDPEPRRDCDSCPPIYSWHLRWNGAGDWNESGYLRGGVRPKLVGLQVDPGRGGALYRGDGNGRFVRTDAPGLDPDINGQGASWLDLNNDGWLDLYAVDASADGVPAQSLLFLNDGNGGFVRAPRDSGATPRITGGRPTSAQSADFDRDGRLDLFLTNGWGMPPFNRGPYLLLRNETEPRHWLEVDLVGTASNRLGLGAWVEIEACGRRQVRLHDGGRSDLSQSVARPHFGLGDCTQAGRIHVRWPSGRETELDDTSVDRVVAITEPGE